jgi:hypothetical protein
MISCVLVLTTAADAAVRAKTDPQTSGFTPVPEEDREPTSRCPRAGLRRHQHRSQYSCLGRENCVSARYGRCCGVSPSLGASRSD